MIEPIKLVEFEPLKYKKYTNYTAINVDDIKQIPDTDEIIGVPITFLDKYNPKQFKILGMSGDREFADSDCDFFIPVTKEQKNIFKEQNKVWTGKTHPANYIKPDGSIYQIRNTIWITNIGENVKKLTLTKKYKENNYIKFHNFDAINVDKVSDIPCDYYGIMGVPITFIEKYDINQFKIVGLDRLPYSIELGIGEMGEQWCNDFFSSGGKGHYTPTMRNLCLYENGQAKIRFSRILIQRKKDCEK